jgi:hypothetical protein
VESNSALWKDKKQRFLQSQETREVKKKETEDSLFNFNFNFFFFGSFLGIFLHGFLQRERGRTSEVCRLMGLLL